MLSKIHLQDSLIFEDFVQDLQTKSYDDFVALPDHAQLMVNDLSDHTTIELSKQFYPIDGAIHIVVTQFLWLSKANSPNLIDGMRNILVPLPNPNPDLIYSGHCKAEFFYVLPNNFITDDIFVRNEHAESNIIEEADWIGKTGLSTKEEQGLACYMRYEYGDLLVDDEGLKAKDLTFIGHFHLNKTLFKKLKLETEFTPKSIYVWHYYDNHFAYAYYDNNQTLHYDIGSNFSMTQFKKLA